MAFSWPAPPSSTSAASRRESTLAQAFQVPVVIGTTERFFLFGLSPNPLPLGAVVHLSFSLASTTSPTDPAHPRVPRSKRRAAGASERVRVVRPSLHHLSYDPSALRCGGLGCGGTTRENVAVGCRGVSGSKMSVCLSVFTPH